MKTGNFIAKSSSSESLRLMRFTKALPASCFTLFGHNTLFEFTSWFNKEDAVREALLQYPHIPKEFFNETLINWLRRQNNPEIITLVITKAQQAGFTVDEFAEIFERLFEGFFLKWNDDVIALMKQVFSEQDLALLDERIMRPQRDFAKELDQWRANEPSAQKDVAYQRILDAFKSKGSWLDLQGLGLHTLPPCIGRLKLTGLYLSENQFRSLPKEIGHLRDIEIISLWENPLESLPSTFRKLRSWGALKNYQHLIEVDLPERFVQVHEHRFALIAPAYGEVRNKKGLLVTYSYENGMLQVRDAAGNNMTVPYEFDGLKISLQSQEGKGALFVEDLNPEKGRLISLPASVKTDAVLGPYENNLLEVRADLDEAINNPEGLLLALHTEYYNNPFNGFSVTFTSGGEALEAIDAGGPSRGLVSSLFHGLNRSKRGLVGAEEGKPFIKANDPNAFACMEAIGHLMAGALLAPTDRSYQIGTRFDRQTFQTLKALDPTLFSKPYSKLTLEERLQIFNAVDPERGPSLAACYNNPDEIAPDEIAFDFSYPDIQDIQGLEELLKRRDEKELSSPLVRQGLDRLLDTYAGALHAMGRGMWLHFADQRQPQSWAKIVGELTASELDQSIQGEELTKESFFNNLHILDSHRNPVSEEDANTIKGYFEGWYNAALVQEGSSEEKALETTLETFLHWVNDSYSLGPDGIEIILENQDFMTTLPRSHTCFSRMNLPKQGLTEPRPSSGESVTQEDFNKRFTHALVGSSGYQTT